MTRARRLLGSVALMLPLLAPHAATASEVPVVVDAAPRLLPLPVPLGDRELVGEFDTTTFLLPLTAAQAIGGVTLRLAYTNALAVAPELSTLDVAVNGHAIGAWPIDGPDGSALEMALPSHVLEVGHNALTVTARQRHRVDCSQDATYELWTRIAPERSGLVASTPPRPIGLADLAALGRAPDGTLPLRVAAPGDADGARIALEAVRGLARGIGLTDARVTWGMEGMEPRTGMTGLDLVIAPPGSDLALVEEDGAITLVIPADEVGRRALSDLAPRGSATGLAALRRARDVVGPGESRSFADLGAADQSFIGRRFVQDMVLRLPADAHPADYADVELDLAFAHAADLDPEARIEIRVNDVIRATLPLHARERTVHRRKTLQIAFGAFRPGRNRITIEALLPHADDAACTPLARTVAAPRFALSASSTLRVPEMARVARSPDLLTAVEALSRAAHPLALVLPRLDEDALSAAATLLVGLDAQVAGLPSLALHREAPTGPDAPATLLVGLPDDLPARVVASLPGLAPDALRMAWTQDDPTRRLAAIAAQDARPAKVGEALSASREEPRLTLVSAPASPTLAPSVAPLRETSDQTAWTAQATDVLAVWDGGGETRREGFDLSSAAKAFWDRAPDFEDMLMHVPQEPMPAMLDDPGQALLAEVGIAGPSPQLVLTAPDGARLAMAAGLAAGAMTSGGATLALDLDAGSGVRVARGARVRMAPRSWSPRNLQLILAAWLSSNALVYAGLMLGTLGVSGLCASRLLRGVGRRFEETCPS